MSSPVLVDIFVEDRAHEAFLVPMLRRIAQEEKVVVTPRVRSGRGGHGRAVTELKLYQDLVQKGAAGTTNPDVLIAGIDGNCSTFAKAKKAIVAATHAPFSDRLVVAWPRSTRRALVSGRSGVVQGDRRSPANGCQEEVCTGLLQGRARKGGSEGRSSRHPWRNRVCAGTGRGHGPVPRGQERPIAEGLCGRSTTQPANTPGWV